MSGKNANTKLAGRSLFSRRAAKLPAFVSLSGRMGLAVSIASYPPPPPGCIASNLKFNLVANSANLTHSSPFLPHFAENALPYKPCGIHFTPEYRGCDSKPTAYGPKSKDYNLKSEDCASKSKDCDSKSEDYESKSEDCGSKPKDYNLKSEDCESKSKDYGSKSKDCESKSEDCGSKSKDYGSKSEDFALKPTARETAAGALRPKRAVFDIFFWQKGANAFQYSETEVGYEN